MYLVDTNIISEARKGLKANAGVRRFFEATDERDLYLSVQTLGEIRRGIENLRQRGDLAQAKQLESWLEKIVTEYNERLLSFDDECAQLWGCLMSPNPHHAIDKQIAAIALIYDLTIVTRNVDDFQGTRASLLNPFV